MCAECDSFFSEDDAFTLGQIMYNHTFDMNEEDFMFIPQNIDIPEITRPQPLPVLDDTITDRIASGELEEPMQKWRQNVFRPMLPRLWRNHLRTRGVYPVVPYDPRIAQLTMRPWLHVFWHHLLVCMQNL